MRKTLFALLGVFFGALLLVGVTFSSAKEDRADYVFVNGTEPKTLDPQKMTGQPEGRIADALWEGLTFRDNDTLRPVAGQAESWEASPDGKRWTFHLREGIRWTNGEPVTAHDFVYAWVRLQEPKIASEYASLMHFVRHAEAYNTYAAHVTALRGDPDAEKPPRKKGVIALIDELRSKHPDGVPAAAWQEFVGNPFQEELPDAPSVRAFVIRTLDAGLLAGLARDTGTIAPTEMASIRDAFSAEADRRAAALSNAQEHFGKDEGVFALDDKTFVVELRAYTPYFLELTSFYVNYPVNRRAVEAHPEDWFTRPEWIVGNGPFRMEKWSVNHKIRMRKNPGYWDAKSVTLETVDALPIENTTTTFNLFLTNEVDWAPSGYPPDLIDVVMKKPYYRTNPGMVVYFYKINTTKPPLNDPRVRRAIGLAFDRRVVTDVILRAGQTPCTTVVAPGVPGYTSPKSLFGYDVPTAKRLLAEAGFPDGKGFPQISILFNTNEAHKKVAEYIAEQLKTNLGITANPVNQEWQSILESMRRLNYDISRLGWIGDYRDPNTFLDLWLTNGGNNQTGWGDPFYDGLIALAADPFLVVAQAPEQRARFLARLKERPEMEARIAAVTAAKDSKERLAAAAALRLQLFREAEAILFQDAFPVIPIYFYVVTSLVHPWVEGYHSEVPDEDGKLIPNLQDLHPFRNVRIKRGAR